MAPDAQIEEIGAQEFWRRCEGSWHDLWDVSERQGNVGLADFYFDLADSAEYMFYTCMDN